MVFWLLGSDDIHYIEFLLWVICADIDIAIYAVSGKYVLLERQIECQIPIRR